MLLRRVERILTATMRSRRVSRALYTSPIPPEPIRLKISYGPSLVPGSRCMQGWNQLNSYQSSLAGCFTRTSHSRGQVAENGELMGPSRGWVFRKTVFSGGERREAAKEPPKESGRDTAANPPGGQRNRGRRSGRQRA